MTINSEDNRRGDISAKVVEAILLYHTITVNRRIHYVMGGNHKSYWEATY